MSEISVMAVLCSIYTLSLISQEILIIFYKNKSNVYRPTVNSVTP